jgi:hypothetical protein
MGAPRAANSCGGHRGLEGFGVVEALLPGLASKLVEVLGRLEVVGLADAVRRILHEGAVHGLGAGEESELAAIVRAPVFRAEIEHVRAVDEALFGDRFPVTEAEMDEVHC